MDSHTDDSGLSASSSGSHSMPISGHALHSSMIRLASEISTFLADPETEPLFDASFEANIGETELEDDEVDQYVSTRTDKLRQMALGLSGIAKETDEKWQAAATNFRLSANLIKTHAKRIEESSPSSEDDSSDLRHKGVMSPHTRDVLMDWLKRHLDHPYPDDDEKAELVLASGASWQQLNNWFVNARRRSVHQLRKEQAKVANLPKTANLFQ